MSPDKWDEIKEKIKEKFEVEEEKIEEIYNIPNGTDETIIFDSPLGKLKAVYTTKPKVLDKTTLYATRIGANTKVEYKYSDTEFTNRLDIFKWDPVQENWERADLDL